MKIILFITSNSLATNPRLVKEVRSCVEAGHKITVLSFSFHNWSKPLNDRLQDELEGSVKLILLPGDRTNKWQWLASTIVSLCSRLLSMLFPGNLYFTSVGFSKRSYLLLSALKRIQGKFDLVIAHNPGAFVPAYYFARERKISLGIDVEDYHPGESDDNSARKGTEAMMKKVFKAASVITFSSPLIFAETENMLSGCKGRFEVIRNVFSRRFQPAFRHLSTEPLKLVWFSQTVGLNRGIQDAVNAMNLATTKNIQLTIIGNCDSDTKQQLSLLLTNELHSIFFLPPLHENELINECSHHHIGLALEPGFSLNNELALSNKIFTYLLAGNAVVASETKAQKAFTETYNKVGSTYPAGAVEKLAALLSRYGSTPSLLQTTRENAYRLASTELSWETESQRFFTVYGLNQVSKSVLATENKCLSG